MKSTKFFNTDTITISTRLNEFMRKNFGYEIEGDIDALREAKEKLEDKKASMNADYMDSEYLETMLMLETIKSLVKVYVEEGSCKYKNDAQRKAVHASKNEKANEGAPKNKEDYLAKKKALQDIQNDPNTAKDPELKAELKRRKAELEESAKNMGLTEGTMIGGLMKYDGQPEEEYEDAVAKYNDFMSQPRPAGEETSDMIMQFVFDDELLDDMYDAEDKNVKDVRPIVAKRMKELGHANESVSEAEERPYVCVHADKGKHECKATSSYGAAKKAAEHWGLKSTAGIDAHLADVEKVAESQTPKVDTDKKEYKNSYKEPKEVNMSKQKLEETLLAQLNNLLEGDAAEAEITMAARGIVDELQDMIEKLGKIQNDQLGPLADEMAYSHGPDQSASFKSTVESAVEGLLDQARTTKDAVNNAVLVLSGEQPAEDMVASKDELGGDIQDDMEDDIAADLTGGDESMSGPEDEPLGRAKRD